MRAYCFASGQIGYGEEIADGALPIAMGSDPKVLMDHVNGYARRAHEKGIYLVPGVPEAANQFAALEKYQDFVKLISGDLPPGVETIHSIGPKKKGVKAA